MMNANLAKKTSMATAPSTLSLAESSEFVVFQLGELEYGIDIRLVQRLRGYRSLTRIANGAEFVEGVAISDGIIMPIVDMRLHFHIETPIFNHFTVVMILEVQERSIGLVVDSVSDVISLAAGEIRPGSEHGADYLSGIAHYQGRSLILLDVEKLMQDTSFESNAKKKA
jgi:purine-binding chemotaxis protein CheW